MTPLSLILHNIRIQCLISYIVSKTFSFLLESSGEGKYIAGIKIKHITKPLKASRCGAVIYLLPLRKGDFVTFVANAKKQEYRNMKNDSAWSL